MAASRQIRLLLWKDYLIRKRNPITLAGVLWATAVVFSLYIVRINVENQDIPSCQFPARALPSAGVMTFLQSFICSVNNECSPMDEFEEIPSYKNAKLTKLKNQLLPLFSNSSLLDTAGSVPHALKLLATLSEVADVPEFVHIAKNGLHMRELFRNPERVKRYLAKELDVAEPVANSLLDSELSFEGLLQGNLDRCNPDSIFKSFKIADAEDLDNLMKKLCPLSSLDIQKLLMNVVLELDLGKYVQMLGNMYYKLSKDDRLTDLGKMAGAALRMISIQSFLPPEITEILYGETPEFSYVQLDVVSNILEYFEPSFGDTQSYKSTKDYANAGVVLIQYLHRFLEKQRKQYLSETTNPTSNDNNKLSLKATVKSVSDVFSNAIEAFNDFADDKSPVDAFNAFDIMSQIFNFIYKWLPDNTKHDVLFYSTLITKLIEGAERVIYINVHLEKLMYNVSLRHPRGIEMLMSLPLDVFEKGLDALVDPERAQLLTSKLDSPGEMFCDDKKLQKFFEIDKDEVVKLRERLCSSAWQDYLTDMIRSFGIYEVRNNINTMASLFIKETLGKDTASQLYSLDHDFAILKNFSRFVNAIEEAEPDSVNWKNVFDVNKNSDIMTMVRNKKHAGNQMLVTLHGVLAKAVVKQNPILEYKISPFLIDATTIIEALNKEVEETPREVAEQAKKLYPAMLRTILTTALIEDKTYKLLSTFSQDALCAGIGNASQYLNFPPGVDKQAVTSILCSLSAVFEKILTHDSHLGKAVAKITSEGQQMTGIQWTKLITDLKNLYANMSQYYPYLFQYKSYGMEGRSRKEVAVMIKEIKSFWFSPRNWSRGIRMSIKLALAVLDLVDREIFDVKSDAWLQIKYNFDLMTGPLLVIDDVVKTVGAITKNETFKSPLPVNTVLSLSKIIPNVAQMLKDATDLIINDDTRIEPIIEVMNANESWPCSTTSLADLLTLSDSSKNAVRASESLLCLPRAEQEKWNEYLGSKNIYKHKLDDGNITRVGTHLFLRFSTAFDGFIEDTSIVKDILLDALDESPGRLTLATAWRYAVAAFNVTQRDHILRNLFAKIDTVVNSIRMPIKGGVPLISLWRNFVNCNSGPLLEEGCREVGRATWLNILKFLSLTMSNVADDLLSYFQEINEPDSNLLQLMGFTKKTGLYMLYDKLPDFIGVLANSYGDYGFMTQIRRAAHSSFWDCEAVVKSLTPAPGSPIDKAIIARVQPFVCPSFLHWISLPRGDNAILDIVAKPQYYFFTSLVDELNSTFENAFTKGNGLSNFITKLSNNKSKTPEIFNLDTAREKLTRAVDIMLNYKTNGSNPSYRMFNEANNKLVISTAYLTRIVTIINKVLNNIENFNLNDTVPNVSENEIKKIQEDVSAFKRIFKRRPADGVAVVFDAVTNNLWQQEEHSLLKAFEATCSRLKNNVTSKVILSENNKVTAQICAMNNNSMVSIFGVELQHELDKARLSLIHFVKILNNKNEDNVGEISKFLKDRKQVISYLKTSIQYAYDLGIPVYLKYLHDNLQHHEVIMTVLSGGDWWQKMRELYNGSYATNFFESIEKIFEIAEDIFNNLDQVHWVRLMRDINSNSKEGFCALNSPLSEYIPDATGALSHLKQQICTENITEVFKELMPLRFASQIYDKNLKISTDVDYTALSSDVTRIEFHLDNISNEPNSPQVPKWVTKDKLERFRASAIALLSAESLTKVSFGLLSNIVDAGTLLLNNSQCILCSQFTTWFKQLNLQLYKKQEYDNLLCHLHEMDLHDVYHTLKTDFHWDMAIKELLSTRNYTKFELNKSINEFLGQTKQHLVEDITAPTTKISQCLTQNVTRNAFGNATLFAKVLAYTIKLVRAELPHLQEIDGIRDVQYLKGLQAEVAHRLDVEVPLKKYLNKGYNLPKSLKELISKDYLIKAVDNSRVNVRITRELRPEDLLLDDEHTWEDLCECCDCNRVVAEVFRNLNTSLIDIDLQQIQEQEFWRFNFISNVLEHVEDLLGHVARLLGVVSKVDVEGVLHGHLVSVIDTAMQLLNDDTLSSMVYSIRGLMTELTPLIKSPELETSLFHLSEGLLVVQDIKNSLLEHDFKVAVSELFSDPDRLEMDLSRLGINNTNFWSIAAPRIQVGHLHLKPIFVSKRDNFRISDFVCEMEDMAKVIVPGNLDVVTSEDVHGAVIEQFCDLEEARAKEVVPILLRNLNFTFIVEKVKDWLLTELYAASELTAAEGEHVLESIPQMAALVPVMQNNIGSLSGLMDNEPLLDYFKTDFSFNNLFGGDSDFMADAGRLTCGKPFSTHVNRYFKSIVEAKDLSTDADSEQLKVLPSEFCRTMYKQIVNINGGKIVWSLVKPLVMGKILYTPATPAVERIIQRANETFAPMVKTINLVHAFAKAFYAVDTLTEHRDGVAALTDLITAPSMKALKISLIGDGEIPDFNIDDVFEKLEGAKDLGGILQKGSDILECMNLNRFKPVTDEQHLSEEAARLMRVNEFSAGLVFLNNDTGAEMPLNVSYKIRMDIENTPTTNRLRNFFWIPGPEANFLDNMRYFRGFIQIQDIVDKAIIDVSADSNSMERREEDSNWAMYTQQIPYPCYRKDFFQTSLYESQSLVVAFFFSLLFTTSSVVRFIVSDKETGNTGLMAVMGVNLSYHTLSWFISSLVELLVTCACIATVLCFGGVLPHTAPALVFILLFIYAFSVLCFCYMLSKLFKAASFAAVCCGLAYMISFMPFVLILSLEALLTSSLKFLVCVSMSSSLCYAFLYILRYEATGLGAQWIHLWSSPVGVDDMSIGLAAILVFVDGIIYILIGLLLDKFYGYKALQKNVISSKSSGEKAGVSVVNVSKVYGSGARAKLALDNVSVELHTGQITTLLGQNGAGKTTLIKIMTGMLKPTQGHVVMRGDREGGPGLGVCPQRDVLVRELTAREHVQLYAQIKSGRRLSELREQIESTLRVLSLGAVADEPVSSLSGGTRRRLCVALAFVAEPGLVVLDEPTAGVDPAARRDIWSMILKLRENRTILLSTHHLDEAELLSDQIVIMHKGQVHTTGSPIEIKRSLGSGYKLTVIYPERSRKLEGLDDIVEEEDLCVEEKTKILLATVRSVIKNANLMDVNGPEIEITLPYFDPDGVSNNYLQLCTLLETNQSELGFHNFNMDCCSLEQVFFNICQQAEATQQTIELETPSKSASTSSLRNDRAPLVPREGPLVASAWEQFLALLYARYIHYSRNRSLLFMLLVLPSLFVIIAMAFSNIRPPPNNEFALRLHRKLYENTTEFLVKNPSKQNESVNAAFAREVMDLLAYDQNARNWTVKDNPECNCLEIKQECDLGDINTTRLPEMMLFSNVKTLNEWLIASQEVYIEKRYGGYSSTISNETSNLVVWYNNKGHHAMPSYLNAMSNAVLRARTGRRSATITTYTHPLKISKEPVNKDTVYQHVADAGITAMILIAYSLVSAGGSVYLVTARCSQEKCLQFLAGVKPVLYWTTALVWDMTIILLNLLITAVVLQMFHFPVFVTRNNLPAICVLIILYGYGCAGVVHVTEKLFSQPSLANMVLFCANTFVGVVGLAVLLILDIISESEMTDNARWILHKVFMLSPQFVLGDGVLEIAKNTIQAQVLGLFGMDTYRDPLLGDLIVYHYVALALMGTVLFLLNLAIEYDCFEVIFDKFPSETIEALTESDPEVAGERRRVLASRAPLRLKTIGNINAGFVDTEDKCESTKSSAPEFRDVAQCMRLGKAYPVLGGRRIAVRDLTLGIPPGQCTALLGQNGAGKSTTFAMLTGQVRPTAGSIYLDGRRVGPRDLCQGLISYCPQSDAIDPLLTVRETLQFYCRLRGITDQEEVIKKTIEMFDLTKYRDVRSGKLSGGNKRKLCTAIAFMGRTPLVLLDEPTSGMDPGSRVCVSRGVQRACSSGRGVLLTTHALEDARRLAARVALLQGGTLRALAPLDDCLRRFGGGHAVWWRVRRGAVRGAGRRLRAAAPQAQLQALHQNALHFLMPARCQVDGKEVTTKLSDVFRLTAEMQSSCDIEDYTVNQSSLDQMFLSFAGSSKSRGTELEEVDPSPPGTPGTPAARRRSSEDASAVTAL